MHSPTVWKLARQPNYGTNINRDFPYSEVPYLGDYHLVKIPVSLKNLIQHVDYWGEGCITSGEGTSGFSNSYNVNHQYHLVSSGNDRDRKIPNRIPVLSETNCDTSAYIKDNSVITVSVVGARLNSSCAQDIARIVNNDLGQVIVYGVHEDSQDIVQLALDLKKKGLISCPNATLPSDLRDQTLHNSYVSFVNVHTRKDDLYNEVINGNYDKATSLSKIFEDASGGQIISETVTKLISAAPRNLMSYAYKLWHSGATDIIRNYFPNSFQLIFNEVPVTIINKRYGQALKLNYKPDSYNDRLAWGDNNSDKANKRVSWKVIPVWSSEGVTFKLYNIDCNMYLKLEVNVDNIGDRKAWGSTNSDEVRHRYYLEPLLNNDGVLVFFIINCQYKQGLKLDANVDNIGDRILWGHNGDIHEFERFRWLIAAW